MCASGFYCSRLSLTFLNILYLAISFVLIGVAGYAKNAGIVVSTPLIGGILAVGVFLFFISILGIIATIKHHQVLLFFYVVILFLLFIIEFSVSISCLALSHTQQVKVLKAAWDKSDEESLHDAMNMLECCGYDRTDYDEHWKTKVHSKFFRYNSFGNFCFGHGLNSDWKCEKEGVSYRPPEDPSKRDYKFCKEKIEDKTDAAVEKTGAVALFFSFTEMFGVWLAIRYRNQRNPAGPDPRAFE